MKVVLLILTTALMKAQNLARDFLVVVDVLRLLGNFLGAFLDSLRSLDRDFRGLRLAPADNLVSFLLVSLDLLQRGNT